MLQIAGLRGGKFVSISPLLEYQVGEGIAPNIFGGFGLEGLWNQGSLLRFWARLLTGFGGFEENRRILGDSRLSWGLGVLTDKYADPR